MFKGINLRALRSEDMALALVLWLCSLPLVGLVVIPFFGLKVAAFVAVVLFFVAMAVCWGICGWKVARD
jgi:uncharacterized membrane protein (DUF4010 family)